MTNTTEKEDTIVNQILASKYSKNTPTKEPTKAHKVFSNNVISNYLHKVYRVADMYNLDVSNEIYEEEFFYLIRHTVKDTKNADKIIKIIDKPIKKATVNRFQHKVSYLDITSNYMHSLGNDAPLHHSDVMTLWYAKAIKQLNKQLDDTTKKKLSKVSMNQLKQHGRNFIHNLKSGNGYQLVTNRPECLDLLFDRPKETKKIAIIRNYFHKLMVVTRWLDDCNHVKYDSDNNSQLLGEKVSNYELHSLKTLVWFSITNSNDRWAVNANVNGNSNYFHDENYGSVKDGISVSEFYQGIYNSGLSHIAYLDMQRFNVNKVIMYIMKNPKGFKKLVRSREPAREEHNIYDDKYSKVITGLCFSVPVILTVSFLVFWILKLGEQF